MVEMSNGVVTGIDRKIVQGDGDCHRDWIPWRRIVKCANQFVKVCRIKETRNWTLVKSSFIFHFGVM